MSKNIPIATVMEITGLLLVFKFHNIQSVLLYLVFHGLASWLIAIALRLLIKREFRKGSISTFSFLIFLSGPAGYVLGLMLYIILMLKGKVSPAIYENVSPELLPDVNFRGRKLGESLGQIRNPVMVLYMSKTYSPVAISYLKESVADEEDEVRLTAFATLSRIESEIVERINLFKKDLEKVKGKRERFALLFSLAELYWEVLYLNIADRELQEFYLAQAEKYALQALELREDPRTEFLLARIYLRKGDYDRAAEHLERAERLGFPKERLLTYLLEVLYRRGDFKKMFEIADEFRGVIPSEPKAASIIKVWM